MFKPFILALSTLLFVGSVNLQSQTPDPIAEMQSQAVTTNTSSWGHWGPNPEKYSSWTTHTNRLIPAYVFGGDFSRVAGEKSIYRCPAAIEKLYGFLPEQTANSQAQYFDQTDIFRLQKWAVESGKKRIILFVFDGMDWHTSRAAAINKTAAVKYDSGRGEGLWFQDYRGAKTDFGYFVSSPHDEGTSVNVDKQFLTSPGKILGGYSAALGGPTPWGPITDARYLNSTSDTVKHAYTDSASSATSMCSGIKTYNDAINIDVKGREVLPIARTLQEQGFAIGVVTSVPISHATPACAYANNVHRDDYQDLTRDMIGRPSVFHPGGLTGVDVLIGGGFGVSKDKDGPQGENFVAGNRYLTDADLTAVDAKNGGEYIIAQRTMGKAGPQVLEAAAHSAIVQRKRLLGYFGAAGGHLPFQTADGRFNPVVSVGNEETAKAEKYTAEDLAENVTLSDMSLAAARVLQARSDKWWLMVEAGDVDWANHTNNIDNSIGAVLSGDAAFKQLTQWIENNGGWDDTLAIVTADHGHYLVLKQPEALIAKPSLHSSP